MIPDEKVIKKLTNYNISFAIILGSGFRIDENQGFNLIHSFSFEEAGFNTKSSVEGHSYKIGLFSISDIYFLTFHGRLHRYEGYNMEEITFPVRFIHRAGIDQVLLTTAAGGISERISSGDLVLISDHINLQSSNPLLEISVPPQQNKFLNTYHLYKNPFNESICKAFEDTGEKIVAGILAAVDGPNYETHAEARYLKAIGADVVSMSLVPEALAAHYYGLQVSGIAAVSNHHFNLKSELAHENVLKEVKETEERFIKILKKVPEKI
ncbi:MAG: purine-nucleoside phosphorylase [Acidobacteria bacterium]|nr:purine-nucleoside phosphorylase [Acidobacteriota bacterium]